MTNQTFTPGGEVTSDDKLWGLLSYIFAPIVPIIVLLMEDKKSRPFLKFHSMQALVLSVVVYVVSAVLSFIFVGICTGLLGAIYLIYLGIKAYQGEYTVIPVVTNFCKNQGWI